MLSEMLRTHRGEIDASSRWPAFSLIHPDRLPRHENDEVHTSQSLLLDETAEEGSDEDDLDWRSPRPAMEVAGGATATPPPPPPLPKTLVVDPSVTAQFTPRVTAPAPPKTFAQVVRAASPRSVLAGGHSWSGSESGDRLGAESCLEEAAPAVPVADNFGAPVECWELNMFHPRSTSRPPRPPAGSMVAAARARGAEGVATGPDVGLGKFGFVTDAVDRRTLRVAWRAIEDLRKWSFVQHEYMSSMLPSEATTVAEARGLHPSVLHIWRRMMACGYTYSPAADGKRRYRNVHWALCEMRRLAELGIFGYKHWWATGRVLEERRVSGWVRVAHGRGGTRVVLSSSVQAQARDARSPPVLHHGWSARRLWAGGWWEEGGRRGARRSRSEMEEGGGLPRKAARTVGAAVYQGLVRPLAKLLGARRDDAERAPRKGV